MKEFLTYYEEEKKQLEEVIYKYNEELIKEENPLLKENLEVFKRLNSSGKRIRGILVNLGYQIKKERSTYSYPLSLAYELFQTSILVHDDIIDQDDKRRGEETIHFYNKEKYQEKSKEKEVEHLSNSIALCMGDYGLYLSNQVISNSYEMDKNLGKVLNYFNQTVLNTIKGELFDVVLPFQNKKIGLEEKILEIYRLKTSYYTFIGPLSVGMILAGTKEDELKDIEELGQKLGIAFQIQDDILGIYSNEMGKVKASDIKEGKQTLLYAYAKNSIYQEELDKIYGKEDLNNEKILKVQEIMEQSGAKEKAEKQMNSYYDESIQLIENNKWMKEKEKHLLKGLIEYLRTRNK
ncbi:MAG: polyprenyl synthetase family protein [Bacilli bacterium]|nr:polyprenyl synthetase family protein [Bacilli bacterium]